MNPIQHGKILELVKSSVLLSEQERKDWLGMLDLMSDKQALELEKILTPVAKPAEPKAASAITKIPPIVSNAGVSKSSQPANVQQRMPFLGHIVNLPKDFSPPATRPQAARFGVSENSKQTAAAPGSGKSSLLSAQLKNILEEKELPAGEEKKELPAAKPLTPTASTIPAFTPPRPTAVPPAVPSKPASMVSSVLKAEAAAKPKSTASISSLLPSKPASPQSGPKFNNFQNITSPVEIKRPGIISPVGGTSGFSGQNQLSTLEDFQKLNLKLWRSVDRQRVKKNLINLLHNFGYHKALFALEISPLYKIYVDSGLKMLTGGAKFEQSGSDSLMTKEEFEKFLDLIKSLQVG